MHTFRRILLYAFLAILLLCFIEPAIAAEAESGGWPMFRHDLNHTGTISSNSTYNYAKLLWTYTTDAAIYSSPAVVNGCVYVGSKDHNVYCFNSSTGEKIWNFTTGAEIISSPAVNNGYLYQSSNDGWFYCLNASSGWPIWIEWLGWNANSCPTVWNGYVIVGSGNHDVVCFNASDGAEVWRYVTADWVLSSPAITEGVVYVATNDFYLHAINASTGVAVWVIASGTADCSPAVYNGCVYIGSYGGSMLCVDAKDGELLWSYQTADSIMSSPAIADGNLYFGSQDNNFYCLNATTGALIWQSKTDYWVCSSPAVGYGCVFVGSEDYGIYCFNSSTGEKLWSYATDNQVVSSPAIADGKLFVGCFDHKLYAFNLYYSTDIPSVTQSPIQTNLSTIAFDITACLVGAALAFLVVNHIRRLWEDRRIAQNVNSNNRVGWFYRHLDAMVLFVVLGFLVAFYLNLGCEVLWAADEQTYSQMAYYITKTGDYLNPHCYGHLAIWTGKPPLLMWLMALSYQVFGITNFAARFFIPLFGAACLVFAYFLGKQLYNRVVGFLSVLILGTLGTFYTFATHAMTDVPLTCFVLASIYFFVVSQNAKSPSRYAVLSGVFFGLAFLTKQTSAVLIPAIILLYLLVSQKSLRPLFTKRVALFLGSAVLLVAAWLIYMTATFGYEFWNCYFLYSTFSRFTTPIEGHAHNYLYYFNYLEANETLIWMVLLPVALGVSTYFAYKRLCADVLLLSWVAVVLLVFTVAQTKLYYYILPAFPAFALAIGVLLYRVVEWFRRWV